ncbi:hypothetical protein THAOC_26289 [Thalassiosira oceanica]|uniref:Uncharacterized protein n=1 Tax=Thalassiosira oceanica TaxID=159749 RepID=K0RKA1_THAOC|nr:hypothetical protein THAOC_26289 [Thalassiosira oceanica]|eukprot:EJK54148.1 hypothetical protein THAOC_26289 [Thalassiosira oceanica]
MPTTKLLSLSKYGRHLQYYGRFIDDATGAWNDLDDPEAFDRFCEDINDFGILRWEVEERCNQIDFLDLTFWINKEDCIMTKTFRKPQNIYQYIPKQSAHPPGVGRASIFGCMRRYGLQNSLRKDYLEQINLLYTHMKARGWPHLLAEWIIKSADKLEHDLSLPLHSAAKFIGGGGCSGSRPLGPRTGTNGHNVFDNIIDE